MFSHKASKRHSWGFEPGPVSSEARALDGYGAHLLRGVWKTSPSGDKPGGRGPAKPDVAEKWILHGASRTSWPYRHSEVTPLQMSGPQSCEVTPVCGLGSPGLRSFVKGAPGHSHSHPDGGALRTRCSFPSTAGVSATPHSCVPPHVCPLRDLLIYTLRRSHPHPRGQRG